MTSLAKHWLGWSAYLDMLLQILRTLEGLATEVTLVWLQGNVYADVRGDVVTLDGGGTARVPLACQVEVVCALSANMTLADVVLRSRISELTTYTLRYNSPNSGGIWGHEITT